MSKKTNIAFISKAINTNRRTLLFGLCLSVFFPARFAYSEVFLSPKQAKQILWSNHALKKIEIHLTDKQAKSISKASKSIVRNKKLHVWRTDQNGWFILDQVIGKHENIDIAVALNPNGSVKGIEVLTYRETYGDAVRHQKWLSQFTGKKYTEHLKLNKQIKNISGATLSCRHITDGINRLTHTWQQVLQHVQ